MCNVLITLYMYMYIIKFCFCLFGLKLYVPVNIFSVMSGPSHRFLGISSTLWEVNVPYSRIQHGDLSEDRTPDALPPGHTAPLLYHEVFYLFNIQLVCNMYRFVIKNFVKYIL